MSFYPNPHKIDVHCRDGSKIEVEYDSDQRNPNFITVRIDSPMHELLTIEVSPVGAAQLIEGLAAMLAHMVVE